MNDKGVPAWHYLTLPQHDRSVAASAMMVIRAWRDPDGSGGLHARIWRCMDAAPDRELCEGYAASVEEVEQAFAEWMQLLRAEGVGGERACRPRG